MIVACALAVRCDLTGFVRVGLVASACCDSGECEPDGGCEKIGESLMWCKDLLCSWMSGLCLLFFLSFAGGVYAKMVILRFGCAATDQPCFCSE